MAIERRNTHLLRVLGAGLVVTVCGWALYWKPRPKPPAAGSAELTLAADHQAYLRERTAMLIQGGRWQEAEPLETELLQTQPENPELLRQDAELEAKLGHDAQAVALWARFRKAAPGATAFCPAQGDACLRLGRRGDAIETFRDGLVLAPRNTAFALALAGAYEQDHQYEQAAQAYGQAVTLDPLLEPALLGLARNQHRLGANRLAMDNLARVLRNAPENVEAILLEGMLLQKARRYLQARKVLEKGLGLAPNDKNIMLALARVAEAAGQYKVAVTWLERVLAKLQGEPEAPGEQAPAKPSPPPPAAVPAQPSPPPPAIAQQGHGRNVSAPVPARPTSGLSDARAASPAPAPGLTTVHKADLPQVLALGARHLQALPPDHWTLRLEVAFLTTTLRRSAAAFTRGAPGLFLLPITAASGAKGYQLLLGDFSSKAAAQEAIRTVPARFRTHGQRPIPCPLQALKAGAAP